MVGCGGGGDVGGLDDVVMLQALCRDVCTILY